MPFYILNEIWAWGFYAYFVLREIFRLVNYCMIELHGCVTRVVIVLWYSSGAGVVVGVVLNVLNEILILVFTLILYS